MEISRPKRHSHLRHPDTWPATSRQSTGPRDSEDWNLQRFSRMLLISTLVGAVLWIGLIAIVIRIVA